MLIDGEKYACDACVRGHRVSNCHHSDRQLQHIAKKGRPVSQCAHCRTLRKSRSAHVKCDCGEKSHTKATCTKATEADSKDTCCCSHGGHCSCALKREYLEAVPESESDEGSKSTSSESRRPRAQTSISENSTLTVFNNGHHRPAQKHNLAHRKQGHPYVPRHPLQASNTSNLANRSVDNLLHLNNVDALHSESHIKDSIVSAQQEQRQVKSEHASPTIPTTTLEHLNAQLAPLDITNFDFNDFSAPLSADPFGYLADFEQPPFSAGGATSDYTDWSLYDGLHFNNAANQSTSNFAISNYSQAPSFSGFDFSNMETQPALTTTSTSGDQSEVDDALYIAGPTRPQKIQKYGSDYNSDMGEDFFRFTMAQNAQSYANMPQSQSQSQTRNPQLHTGSNNGSGIDLDQMLKDDHSAYGFCGGGGGGGGGLPLSYNEHEKYIPETYAAYAIPADEPMESPWYNFLPQQEQGLSEPVGRDGTWL